MLRVSPRGALLPSAALLLALAIAPAGAGAATKLVPRGAVHAGPVLAGEGVAWAEPGLVVVSGPDGARNEIAVPDPVRSVDGSQTDVAVVGFAPSGDASILAGPLPAGPLKPIVTCSRRVETPLASALGASRLAYNAPRCGDPARTLAVDVVDLTGSSPTVVVPQPADAEIQRLRLAGGLLGVLRSVGSAGRSDIVVLDASSGEERLRVDLGRFASVSSFALQDDGAVVWCDDRSGLRWASPASPAVRAIPDTPCAGVELAGFGGGRVVYYARTPDLTARLRSVDLLGSGDTLATGGGRTLEAADSDGSRTAVLMRTCVGEEIAVTSAGEPALRGAECPVRVSGIALRGQRRLRLRVGCPHGCQGRLTATLRAGRQERVGEQRLRLAAGRSRAFSLALPRGARRLLARYSSATLYVMTSVTSSSRPDRTVTKRVRGTGSAEPSRRPPSDRLPLICDSSC